MTGADWQGFYGTAYRLLLKQGGVSDIDEMAWRAVLELHARNPASERHWEFLAIGYLHLFDRDDRLSPVAADRLGLLLSRFQRRPRTSNWRLMAQVLNARLGNRLLASADLAACRLSPTAAGFLSDEPGSCSSQYHAYMLLLIMRFGDPGDERLRMVVEQAVRWMVKIHRQYGDPSPIGRGRFQVFGYAAMAAVAGLAPKWNVPNDRQWMLAVWNRCLPESPSGSMSAVWTGPHRTHLIHGYNTTDDYPAFAALWMRGLSPPDPLVDDGPQETGLVWWHKLDEAGSGVLAGIAGPVAALLIEPDRRREPGLRQLARNLLNRSRRPQSPECTPARLGAMDAIRHGGFMLSRPDGRFILRVDQDRLTSMLVTATVTVWLPRQTPTSSFSGSCELEQLWWQRPGTPAWHGLKARIARHGDLRLEWTP